jgi:hypothetical protein
LGRRGFEPQPGGESWNGLSYTQSSNLPAAIPGQYLSRQDMDIAPVFSLEK